MNLLAISTDLMITSTLEGVSRSIGAQQQVAAPGAAADAAKEHQPAAAVIDLASPIADVGQLVDSLRTAAPGVKLIAFGPHVHKAKLDAADQAGCDRVMSRGEFHAKAAVVLKELLAQ